MPRNRERKTNRQSWSRENMEQAIDEVMSGRVGYLKASKKFHVPQSSLEDGNRKAKQQNLTPTESSTKGMERYKSIFSEQPEHELTDYILLMESRLFGLTLTDVRELAHELPVENNLCHTFNDTLGMAGKDWLYNFLNRNKNLSLRDPELTSISRAMEFNKVLELEAALEAAGDKEKYGAQTKQEGRKTNAKTLLTKIMTLQILNAFSATSYTQIPKADKGGFDALNAEDTLLTIAVEQRRTTISSLGLCAVINEKNMFYLIWF
ncbi:hypothetical protein JTB14_008322 [Gonioctena quinquepunctata]|nr:hypothetical protein JTB14_008322 [Gonioctena quinquepunctata]